MMKKLIFDVCVRCCCYAARRRGYKDRPLDRLNWSQKFAS